MNGKEFCFAALAISTALVASPVAAIRMVGVVASDEGAMLLKRFEVRAGTVIAGVEFTSNDAGTIFPEVVLIRDVSTTNSAWTVAGAVTDAGGTTRPGVVDVLWPAPTVAFRDAEYYVAVRFPIGRRKEGPGLGPAIGAFDVLAPNGSYITSAPGAALIPILADLDIRLLTGTAGKANADGLSPGEDTQKEGLCARFFLTIGSPLRTGEPSRITFGLERPGPVTVTIFDVAGHRVRILQDGALPAGEHYIIWDGLDDRGIRVPSAMYLVKLLHAGGRALTHKLVMVK